MKIAIDAIGGDYAPKEIILGVNRALEEEGLLDTVYLVGDEAAITPFLANPEDPRIHFVQTTTCIDMNEHPAMAYRKKKDASITLASRLVKEGEADAVLSAGSTGAQLVTALFEIGRIKGIQRPAIAVSMPKFKSGHVLMLDAGANTEVDEINLIQFAHMGHICYPILHATTGAPRLALINNGTEPAKGTELMQKSYQTLMAQENLNFIGFVEGNHLLDDTTDVLITDGFTGNIILKTLEGMGSGFFRVLKNDIMASQRFKLGALLLKPLFASLKNRMDAKKVGGAPLLGINGISIVCHGNSNAEAIYNGVLIAKRCLDAKLVEQIAGSVTTLKAGDEMQ